MSNHHISDTPINNPDNDLLGMKSHAEMLGKFISEITPPFIIGVYGQWGEGKTSYVDLTRYYLERVKNKPVVFINFSAWPFTTSDELWRALTFEIAQKICEADRSVSLSSSASSLTEQPPDNFWEYLSRFLSQDAVVFWKQPESPQPHDTCADLDQSLNQGLSRSISRRSDAQVGINQEAAFMAILNSVLAAVGSISPLVAGLRSFLGLDKEVKLAEIIRQQKSDVKQETLDSIQKLKDSLKKLFTEKAKDKQVYVFVDDLDRCLPDVALDLLEAIKIFFADVNCIFLIAADENLIGQGLRLRYRDLFEQGDPKKVEELLTQKGREYFEKVIQFGVRVPPRTPTQTHHFISAQYPRWMPATDIIQVAVGNNPRRLKQYCSVLSFVYEVSQGSNQIAGNQE
jgi:predicted KAP-like P-loop ATPase